MEGCLSIGDSIVLRPHWKSWMRLWRVYHWIARSGLLQQLFPDAEIRLGDPAMSAFQVIAQHEMEGVEKDKQPAWVAQLPIQVRRHIHANRAHEALDPVFMIINEIPFTGIQCTTMEDGLLQQVVDGFNLRRLRRTRQLSFLHIPAVNDTYQPFRNLYLERYGHGRFAHTFDVFIIGMLIAKGVNLSYRDEVKLGFATATHDALTPGGGDTTKIIDRLGLDEDRNYPEILTGEAWREFVRRFNFTQKEIWAIIRNEGLLGKLLDIADKIAYVANDTKWFRSLFPSEWPDLAGTQMINQLVTRYPLVCGIWDSVRVQGENPYFTNAKRLGVFLELRAILGTHLYWHPGARIEEVMLANIILKPLYRAGILTREFLLAVGDDELAYFLKKTLGTVTDTENTLLCFRYQTHIRGFKSKEAATHFEVELKRNGCQCVVLEEAPAQLKVPLDWLVRSKKGIQPFGDAEPEHAAKIMELSTPRDRYRVYWVENSAFSRNLTDALRRVIPALPR
ncbi:MAG: hypothetical protein A3H59_00870 [Candidatus Jacksonbacteria bacterium RIFCSPLOWO2_02_FULL_43_9]|nr:MAG: hypothetical protein A3H59_00870 [Candidatus Jacksonbacteria bacterium RIFCSPLOWO2_02_FULL_43_9]